MKNRKQKRNCGNCVYGKDVDLITVFCQLYGCYNEIYEVCRNHYLGEPKMIPVPYKSASQWRKEEESYNSIMKYGMDTKKWENWAKKEYLPKLKNNGKHKQ